MKLRKFNELKTHETTQSFVVDKETKKIEPMDGNTIEYWSGSGDKKGTIDMEIKVHTNLNHKKDAERVYEALCRAGLQDRYYFINVGVK